MATYRARPRRLRGQRRGLTHLLALGLLAPGLLAAAPAWSQERLWLAGAEVSPGNSYAYAGVLLPAFGGNLGEGFVQRYWVDRVTYRYDSNGQTIEAKGPGAEAALGYVTPTTGGSLSGMLGLVYRDTRLSPDDPDSAARGAHWRVKAQGEFNHALTDELDLDLMASYVLGQRGYWSRARLGHALGNGLRAGPELVIQGDPDYRVTQYGAFLTGLRLSSSVQAGVKAGMRDQRDESTRGYLGLELTGLF